MRTKSSKNKQIKINIFVKQLFAITLKNISKKEPSVPAGRVLQFAQEKHI